MSEFAQNIMLGSICFFVGVAVGQLAALWAMAASDTPATQPKPRVVLHHADDALPLNPAAEFEPMPALDVLARSKVKPSQIRNDGAQLQSLGRRADDWKE